MLYEINTKPGNKSTSVKWCEPPLEKKKKKHLSSKKNVGKGMNFTFKPMCNYYSKALMSNGPQFFCIGIECLLVSQQVNLMIIFWL